MEFWWGVAVGVFLAVVGGVIALFVVAAIEEHDRVGTKTQDEWEAERRLRGELPDRRPWGRA